MNTKRAVFLTLFTALVFASAARADIQVEAVQVLEPFESAPSLTETYFVNVSLPSNRYIDSINFETTPDSALVLNVDTFIPGLDENAEIAVLRLPSIAIALVPVGDDIPQGYTYVNTVTLWDGDTRQACIGKVTN